MKSYIYYDEDAKLHVNVYSDNKGNLCPYYLLPKEKIPAVSSLAQRNLKRP